MNKGDFNIRLMELFALFFSGFILGVAIRSNDLILQPRFIFITTSVIIFIAIIHYFDYFKEGR